MIDKSFFVHKKLEVIVIAVFACLRGISMYFYELNFNPMIKLPIPLHIILSFVVFYVVFSLIKHYEKKIEIKSESSPNKVKPFSDKKVFIISSIGLLLVWIIPIIIRYPGAMSWDTWVMLDEYFYSEISEYQSIFYTYFLGVFITAFDKLGNPDVGLYLFVIINSLFYVGVFAYSFVTLNRLCAPKYWFVVTALVYVFSPYIVGYLGVVIKDCLYAGLVFAAILLIINIKISGECDSKSLVPLAIFILLACLTRKNGVYVFVIYLASLYIIPRVRNQKENVKIRLHTEFALILYLVVVVLLRVAIDPIPDNSAEMYSLPFQQTARYVREHPDDVTDEEREIIDRVLDYDNLATNYNPRLSDPVKNGSNGSITVIRPYFKVWFNQFLRHPVTCISATWEQNYYFFVPEAEYEDKTYFINAHECYGLGPIEYIGAYTEMFNPSDKARDVQFDFLDYTLGLHKIPVLRIFWNTSYAMYILAFITLELIIRKKDVSLLIPLWMTIAFVIIGPVLHGHPRYMLPVIYVLPILISFYRYISFDSSKQKN